jgi:hypothetical protein
MALAPPRAIRHYWGNASTVVLWSEVRVNEGITTFRVVPRAGWVIKRSSNRPSESVPAKGSHPSEGEVDQREQGLVPTARHSLGNP